MVKRALVIIVAGTLLGLAAFLIQVKRGKIKIETPVQKPVEESQKVGPTPTEEDILKGNISMSVTKVFPGDRLVVDSVRLILPGFVVVYEDASGNSDAILGSSDLLRTGDSKNIEIKLKRKLVNGEKIFLGLHTDDGNAAFDGPNKDIPIMTRGSIPVRREFTVGL